MTLLQDVRFGLRMLLRAPGFSAVAILTLALGIGSNVAIVSLVKAVLVPRLPFADPGRLVQIEHLEQKTGQISDWIVYRDSADYISQSRTLESLGTYRYAILNATGGGRPEALYGAVIGPGLLPTLGVAPRLGRFFLPEESRPARNRVIILSDDLWRSRYAADPAIVGKTIQLAGNGAPGDAGWIVIGVMPPGFNFPLSIPSAITPPSRQMAFWIPFAADPLQQQRDGMACMAVGKLRPGVSIPQARADLEGIAATLARQFPDTNAGRGVHVLPVTDYILGQAGSALRIALIATCLVVLIACANLVNLLLARSAARAREIAIRLAMGASRARLVRQGLTETLLIALAGGALGVVFAAASRGVLVRLAPAGLPGLDRVGMDSGMLAFAIGISALAGLMVGVGPAWRSARMDPQAALAGARGSIGGSRGRTRRLLVVSEVALSVLLTVGAGLLVKSFSRLLAVDPGYRPERVLTSIIVLPNSRYPDVPMRLDFFGKLLDELQSMPGVESAGVVAGVPLSGAIPTFPVRIEGAQLAAGAASPMSEVLSMSAGYLQTVGILLDRGRGWTRQEALHTPNLALVNQVAAERFWPGKDPIGKRIAVSSQPGVPWYQVTGIVKATHDEGLDVPPQPAIYIPMEARYYPPSVVAVRTAPGHGGFSESLRRAVERVDKDQAVYVVASMQSLIDNSVAGRRFGVTTLTIFGVLALILAAAGIYGVVSYSVAQRTGEIGVRMALGAQTGDVLRMVLRQGLGLTAVGVAIGLAGAFVLTRALSGLLFAVSATDPAVFAGVPLLLAAVELLACYVPARRAAAVDPVTALRAP